MSISVSRSCSSCSRRAADVEHLEDLLLLLELQRQVRGDRVRQAPGVVDAGQRGEHLRRDLLVQLHVLVELREQRAAHRLDLVANPAPRSAISSISASKFAFSVSTRAMRARCTPSTSTFTVPSGSFSICRIVETAADVVEVLGIRLVLGRRLLRHQHDVLALLHRGLQRLDRLGPPHEQRDHHVREDHHVAQGQQRAGRGIRRRRCAVIGLSWIVGVDDTWGAARRAPSSPAARERTSWRTTGGSRLLLPLATFGWSE